MRFKNLEEFIDSDETIGTVFKGTFWTTFIKRNYGLYDFIYESNASFSDIIGPAIHAITLTHHGEKLVLFNGHPMQDFLNKSVIEIITRHADDFWDEGFRCNEETWNDLLTQKTQTAISDVLLNGSDLVDKAYFLAAKTVGKPLSDVFDESIMKELSIRIPVSSADPLDKWAELAHIILPALLETDPYKRESLEAKCLLTLAKDQINSLFYPLRIYLDALWLTGTNSAPFQEMGKEAYEHAAKILEAQMKVAGPSCVLKVVHQGGTGVVTAYEESPLDVLSSYGVKNRAINGKAFPWDKITTVKQGNKIIWRK